ncbi:unnamed protein product [Ixodes persulcatus]
MQKYVSPVNPAVYPHLTLVLMGIGLFFMAWFFVYPFQSDGFTQKPCMDLACLRWSCSDSTKAKLGRTAARSREGVSATEERSCWFQAMVPARRSEPSSDIKMSRDVTMLHTLSCQEKRLERTGTFPVVEVWQSVS